MEKTIVSKYIRISPKKLRMVVEAVKGKKAQDVLDGIKLTPRKSTRFIYDIVKSCLSQFDSAAQKDAVVKNLFVDKGPMFKRWRPGGRGMAHKYVHRTSHLSVTLKVEDKNGK